MACICPIVQAWRKTQKNEKAILNTAIPNSVYLARPGGFDNRPTVTLLAIMKHGEDGLKDLNEYRRSF
jgi:hypothetical protein